MLSWVSSREEGDRARKDRGPIALDELSVAVVVVPVVVVAVVVVPGPPRLYVATQIPRRPG